jgi:dienelactone hydrolase
LDEEQAGSIHCSVLLRLAERDEFDPPEVLEQFVAALRAAGTLVEARTWPGTGHASANADVPLYAPTQAAEA